MGLDMKVSREAVLAELLAMTAFVFIGPGAAVVGNTTLGIALSFGFAITALAYTFGHYSGAHINPAVTFGLVVAGKCNIMQGVANILAQIMGAFCGAGILAITIDHENDKTGNLGCNTLSAGVNWGSAFMGEAFMTGLLMLVVLETAVSPRSADNRILAPIAIGLTVYLAHSVLIPVDGCSINPARSFGPALWASMLKRRGAMIDPHHFAIWHNHWIFWFAPLVGAGVVGAVNRLIAMMGAKSEPKAEAADRTVV